MVDDGWWWLMMVDIWSMIANDGWGWLIYGWWWLMGDWMGFHKWVILRMVGWFHGKSHLEMDGWELGLPLWLRKPPVWEGNYGLRQHFSRKFITETAEVMKLVLEASWSNTHWDVTTETGEWSQKSGLQQSKIVFHRWNSGFREQNEGISATRCRTFQQQKRICSSRCDCEEDFWHMSFHGIPAPRLVGRFHVADELQEHKGRHGPRCFKPRVCQPKVQTSSWVMKNIS